MKRFLLSMISGLLFLSSCQEQKQKATELPYYHSPDFSPVWNAEDTAPNGSSHTIGDFSFTNQEGLTISQNTFKGKVYVANFFFTICNIVCPKMTNNLKVVAEAYQENPEIMFISHSVTPHIDDVAKLKEYSDFHGIDSQQWHLVTGEMEEIYTLARQSYFSEKEIGYDRTTDDFLHTEHLLLIDKDGHIRGLYNGTQKLEAERLIDDIDLLLKG